jgi:hypothetical protein
MKHGSLARLGFNPQGLARQEIKTGLLRNIMAASVPPPTVVLKK